VYAEKNDIPVDPYTKKVLLPISSQSLTVHMVTPRFREITWGTAEVFLTDKGRVYMYVDGYAYLIWRRCVMDMEGGSFLDDFGSKRKIGRMLWQGKN
jgi:hypothetical protein